MNNAEPRISDDTHELKINSAGSGSRPAVIEIVNLDVMAVV